MLINQSKFRSLSGNPLLVMPNDGDTLLQSAKGTTNILCKLHDCVIDDTGIIYNSELIQMRSIRTYTCIPTHKTTAIVAPSSLMKTSNEKILLDLYLGCHSCTYIDFLHLYHYTRFPWQPSACRPVGSERRRQWKAHYVNTFFLCHAYLNSVYCLLQSSMTDSVLIVPHRSTVNSIHPFRSQ